MATRVLVIDPCPDTQETLGLLLEFWGYEVQTASRGPEALERAPVYQPDAVIMDVALPGLDGYEVARRLRAMPGLANALLIAVTGYGTVGHRQRAFAAGFDYHLVKPAEPEDLRRLLAAVSRPASLARGADREFGLIARARGWAGWCRLASVLCN